MEVVVRSDLEGTTTKASQPLIAIFAKRLSRRLKAKDSCPLHLLLIGPFWRCTVNLENRVGAKNPPPHAQPLESHKGAKTKDTLHVMKMLRHKNIQNTLPYTQLINSKNDEPHSATATTLQDTQKIVEAGFEYVCEFNEVKTFRRRK